MAAAFSLAWTQHLCVDTHLPPNPKLIHHSILAYLAKTDRQREFTEAQGCILSPLVTTSSHPDGQLDVTAANTGGQLWTYHLETEILLTINSRFIWKQKELFPQILLFLHLHLCCVGCRRLGSTDGWFPATLEWWWDSYISPTRDVSPREWSMNWSA